MVFPSFDLRGESLGREIQNYVRSETSLDARKRKVYVNSQKEKGLLIKRYLKNKSALQSNKGKSAAATQNMVEFTNPEFPTFPESKHKLPTIDEDDVSFDDLEPVDDELP